MYTPTRDELTSLLKAALSPSPIAFLVIDGLDECDKEVRREVLSIISWAVNLDSVAVKFYISSQSDVQILNALETYPKIHLSAATLSYDIDSYVADATRTLVQEGALRIQDPHLEHEIMAKLAQGAKGM